MARFLGLRGTNLGFAISTVCGLCFFVFGYSQGDFGGLLTQRAFLDQFPQIDALSSFTGHKANIIGIAVATWNIGCFVSAILTIFLGDLFGRRRTLMIGITLWVIGEVIQASSYSFGQLIAGRFIAGFGNGFTTATVPAYQAECVKSHRKGTILMVTAGAFIAAGLSLSYWMTFAFSFIEHSSASWRVPIAMQCPFAIVAFILLFWLPESPRWLILTGREQEALTVLGALNDVAPESDEVRDEFLQIKDAILELSSASTKGLLSNTETRHFHRATLAVGIQVFQQMTGINLFLQYLGLMFVVETSYTPQLSRLLAGCASTTFFIACFVSVIGIDRFWGRRSLMMFGATGMAMCMVLLCVLCYLHQHHQVYGTNAGAAVFIFLFSAFFAIGWQGMAWLYQVEIVPLRIRGPANALSTSANWLVNFMVVLITPVAFHNIGYRTYIIFAVSNAAIVPILYFFYPETAYRSLEEVSVLFHLASQTKNPYLSVVKIAQIEPLWFGRRGENDFEYGKSEWHAKHVRFSSSGTTLEGEAREKQSRDGAIAPSSSPDSNVRVGSSGSPTSSNPSDPSSGRSGKQLVGKKNSFKTAATTGAVTGVAGIGAMEAARHHQRDEYGNVRNSRNLPSSRSRSRSFSKPTQAGYYSDAVDRTRTQSNDMESIANDFADLAPPPLLFNSSSRSRSTNSGRPSSELAHGLNVRPGVMRTQSGRDVYEIDGHGIPHRSRTNSAAGGARGHRPTDYFTPRDESAIDDDYASSISSTDVESIPEGIVHHANPDPLFGNRRRGSSAQRPGAPSSSAAAAAAQARIVFPVEGTENKFEDSLGRRYRFSAITETSERSERDSRVGRAGERDGMGERSESFSRGRGTSSQRPVSRGTYLARDAGRGF